MRHDILEQALVALHGELLEVRLPPDLFLELGPGDAKGVLDRAASAGRVRVVNQGAVHTKLGGVGLLSVVRTTFGNTTAVVGNGLVEELIF